jgi:hypothetical protein
MFYDTKAAVCSAAGFAVVICRTLYRTSVQARLEYVRSSSHTC